MDCSVSIGFSKGQARSPSRGGGKISKGRREEMTEMPSIVLGYTINLTTLKVAIVQELGQWSWSIMLELGVR